MVRFFTFLFLIALGFQSPLAFSEPQAHTYDAVLAKAIENSPMLLEFKAALLAQRAEGIAINTAPNPELFGEVRPFIGDSKGQEIEYEIGIAQPISLSHFGLRARVAKLIEKASTLEEKLKLMEFEQQILLSYGKVWALQEKERFTKEAYNKAKKLEQSVTGENKGASLRSTQKLFEASRKKLEAQLQGVVGDKERAVAELTRKVGISFKDESFTAPALVKLPETLSKEAICDFGIVERLKLRGRLADAQAELSRLDAFPQFSPKVSFEHTNEGSDRIVVGLSIGLPVSDRNQAERLKAEAERRSQDALSKYEVSGGLYEEVFRIFRATQNALSQVHTFSTQVIPALQESLKASELEVSAGQASPFQTWQILLELVETQDRYLELWIKALGERTELSILTGKQF